MGNINTGAIATLTAQLSKDEVTRVCLVMLESKGIDMAHFHMEWRRTQEGKTTNEV